MKTIIVCVVLLVVIAAVFNWFMKQVTSDEDCTKPVHDQFSAPDENTDRQPFKL